MSPEEELLLVSQDLSEPLSLAQLCRVGPRVIISRDIRRYGSGLLRVLMNSISHRQQGNIGYNVLFSFIRFLGLGSFILSRLRFSLDQLAILDNKINLFVSEFSLAPQGEVC